MYIYICVIRSKSQYDPIHIPLNPSNLMLKLPSEVPRLLAGPSLQCRTGRGLIVDDRGIPILNGLVGSFYRKTAKKHIFHGKIYDYL